MNKVFDDLWRIIIYSLISLVVVVNLLHYLNNHNWWKIEEIKGEDESPDGSSIFWFLEDASQERHQAQAELFVHNILQERDSGFSGFFHQIFPGQYFFIRIRYADKTAYSPVFILRNGEVRRLNFVFSPETETLSYQGTTSRRIKIKTRQKPEPVGQLVSLVRKNAFPAVFLQNLK